MLGVESLSDSRCLGFRHCCGICGCKGRKSFAYLKRLADLLEDIVGEGMCVLIRVDHKGDLFEEGAGCVLLSHHRDCIHDHRFGCLSEFVHEENLVEFDIEGFRCSKVCLSHALSTRVNNLLTILQHSLPVNNTVHLALLSLKTVFVARDTVAVNSLSASVVLLASALCRSEKALACFFTEDVVLNLLLHLSFFEVCFLVTLATVIALDLINFLVMFNVENCHAPFTVNSNLLSIRAIKNFNLLSILSEGSELFNVVCALATPMKGVKCFVSHVGFISNGLERLLNLFY